MIRNVWLCWLVVWSGVGAAAPKSSPIAFNARAWGSSLVIEFRNTSRRTVTMPIRVVSDEIQYDWLTVTATTTTPHARSRTFAFTLAREHAATETTAIEPNQTVSESIDLVPWAVRTGDPLDPGDYDVAVTWVGDEPIGRLTASTRITIAAPIAARCTGVGTGHLDVLARQIGTTSQIMIGLHNPEPTTRCVQSGLFDHERQSPFITIEVGTAQAGRVLKLAAPTGHVELRTFDLPPGATEWTRWDLDDWARRPVNGKAPLGTLDTFATVHYDTSKVKDGWQGVASSKSFAFKLP